MGVNFPKTSIDPAWFGYSVGKWEGDTLVVNTVGINANTWLDDGGHPHTDALHVTERFRRPDFGHIEVQLTIDDPKAYSKPWTVKIPWKVLPDAELLDWVCENEKDVPHMVGRQSSTPWRRGSMPSARSLCFPGIPRALVIRCRFLRFLGIQIRHFAAELHGLQL